eukprot:6210859-Pleurochrysis_carterae.AAC.1
MSVRPKATHEAAPVCGRDGSSWQLLHSCATRSHRTARILCRLRKRASAFEVAGAAARVLACMSTCVSAGVSADVSTGMSAGMWAGVSAVGVVPCLAAAALLVARDARERSAVSARRVS